MLKWGRNYKIIFEIGERRNLTEYVPLEEVEVAYPFTLHLQVESGINNGNVSMGSFQLYNLSSEVQAKLWKDNFNQTKYITMNLCAGYGKNMPLIYRGDVLQCYSYRESGGVDYITDIQTSDGSYLFQYGIANTTFTGGTEVANLLKTLLEETPLYKVGYISPTIEPLRRDKTFIGQTLDLLGREYGNYQIYIDKGELNIIADNEVVPGSIPVITAESGLLGSPRRAELSLKCDMLFEPGILLGQAVELLSDSLSWVNNIYKVISVAHKGIISPVECGSLITTLTLYLGTAPFEELKKQTITTYSGSVTNGIWQKPVQGRVTSPYGYRTDPVTKEKKFHKGMDIGTGKLGVPIVAPANGKVVSTGYDSNGYGNFIFIDNGKINDITVTSRYGHLQAFAVASGDVVSAGQVIGYVGSTGKSTGPHLHLEIRENKTPVNPVKYIGNY